MSREEQPISNADGKRKNSLFRAAPSLWRRPKRQKKTPQEKLLGRLFV